MRDDSWRGGFLLAALEMYLKNDMRSKFHFLNDLEVRQKYDIISLADWEYCKVRQSTMCG